MLSYGEKLLRNILESLLPEEEIWYNFRPNWLCNPRTGKNLELDVFIPRLKLAFEFHGEQHLSDLGQAQRDNTKRRLCKEQHIKLREITARQLSYFHVCKLLTNIRIFNKKINKKASKFKVNYNSRDRRNYDYAIKQYRKQLSKIPGHTSHEILYDSKNWLFSLKTFYMRLRKEKLAEPFGSILQHCKEKHLSIVNIPFMSRHFDLEVEDINKIVEILNEFNLCEKYNKNSIRLAPVLFDRAELYSWNREIWT